MLHLSDLKIGIKNLVEFLKRPYNPLQVLPATKRFGFWHEHICLPLRLGKNVFEYACPYAKEKDFEYEYMDECEYCPYFAILSGENGEVTLHGDSRFLDGTTWDPPDEGGETNEEDTRDSVSE